MNGILNDYTHETLLSIPIHKVDYVSVFRDPEGYLPEILLLLIYRYLIEGNYSSCDELSFAFEQPLIQAVLPEKLSTATENDTFSTAYELIASVQQDRFSRLRMLYCALQLRTRFFKSILDSILFVCDGEFSPSQWGHVRTIFYSIRALEV